MPKQSAGLLLYAFQNGEIKVLLVHPGGPIFSKKDKGAWSIPKGEIEDGDDALTTAIREFEEEIGIKPNGDYLELGEIQQKGGKRVAAWAFRGHWEEGKIPKSNTFQMEWPPKSGKTQEFPEIDRAELFSLTEAIEKINPAQVEFLQRLKIIAKK